VAALVTVARGRRIERWTPHRHDGAGAPRETILAADPNERLPA
jgi:hypothetical protein